MAKEWCGKFGNWQEQCDIFRRQLEQIMIRYGDMSNISKYQSSTSKRFHYVLSPQTGIAICGTRVNVWSRDDKADVVCKKCLAIINRSNSENRN